MTDIILEHRDDGFKNTTSPGYPYYAVYRGKKFEKWMRKVLFSGAKFKDLKIPLVVCATDIDNMRAVYFEKGDLAMAIRASSAFPGLFHPYRIGGTTYSDGGILQPVTVDILRKKGYEKIVAFSLTHYNVKGPLPSRNLHNVANRVAWGMLGELSERVKGDDVYMISPKFSASVVRMMDVKRVEEYYSLGKRELEKHWDGLEKWLEL